MQSQCSEILQKLKALCNPKNAEGMARFGINPKNTYGVSIPVLRKMAKEIGKNRELAQELWASGVHEARILAALVDEPKKVTEAQMDEWAEDLDSWDVCDQVCNNLFSKTEFAHKKAVEWSIRKEEFVKRAGFVLMATLAVHDKKAPDSEFLKFLPIIKRESVDSRNFVKKAVNWALRQIGKRNSFLNKKAIETAKQILEIGSECGHSSRFAHGPAQSPKAECLQSARWIANGAIRELESDAVRKKIERR